MESFCFKCNTNPCTCGAMYKDLDKQTLYKILLFCKDELINRFEEKLNIDINNKTIEQMVVPDAEPLFNNFSKAIIFHDQIPSIWKSVLMKKDQKVNELLRIVFTTTPNMFPLIGMFSFVVLAQIQIKQKKSTLDLFMKVVKALYDRETPIRDFIETCGTNYIALTPKLKTIITDKEQWSVFHEVCEIINQYIELDKKQTDLNPLIYVYQLLQCYCFDSIVDFNEHPQLKHFEDEMFYGDMKIFDVLKKEEVYGDILHIPVM